jgi:hypothetical protein
VRPQLTEHVVSERSTRYIGQKVDGDKKIATILHALPGPERKRGLLSFAKAYVSGIMNRRSFALRPSAQYLTSMHQQLNKKYM